MASQTPNRMLSLIIPEPVRPAFRIKSRYAEMFRENPSRTAKDDLNETLSMAVDQSPASIMLTDLDGKIQYVNRRFTDLTGYTAADAIGQNASLLDSGSNPPALYAELWKTVLGGEIWRGEIENRKKNGEVYWASTSVSPMRDSAGVVSHFLGRHEDATACNVENRVRQAQRMEAVGRLAGGVAHDFNNLLTVIMAYTRMIEEELGPTSPLLEDLDEIQKASTAAAALTKRLLAYSRKQVIEPKPVFVDEVVDLGLQRHAPTASKAEDTPSSRSLR